MRFSRVLVNLLFFAALGIVSKVNAENFPYLSQVNPLMGTQSNFALSSGNTYPAIALPWGMNF